MYQMYLVVGTLVSILLITGARHACLSAGDEGSAPDLHLIKQVEKKEGLFRSMLIHPRIKATRSFGLWLALEFDSFETNKKVIDKCISGGILTDWFLFAPECLRISPSLTISEEQIERSANFIIRSLD